LQKELILAHVQKYSTGKTILNRIAPQILAFTSDIEQLKKTYVKEYGSIPSDI
jgi:hypothetical protein